MKEGVARASFSLPPELLKDLDRVTKEMGYEERSRALQIAIRNLVTESELAARGDALTIGTILVLYNHEKRGIDYQLTHMGHQFSKSIVSSLHVHLDEEQCLNIIVVKGEVKTILRLEQELRGIAGVTQLKFSHIVPAASGV